MTTAQRRIIFYIFFVLFVLTATVVVLFTTGFRFNLEQRALLETGLISVQSVPAGAGIFIDGKPTSKKTPAQIGGLLSGTYRLKLDLPQFYSWEKTVEVKNRLTTFVHNVVLFRKSAPSVLAAGELSSVAFSADRNRLAYETEEKSWREIWIIEKKPELRLLVSRAPTTGYEPATLSWSQNGKKLLIVRDKPRLAAQIVTPDKIHPAILDVNEWPAGASRARWGDDDNHLVIITKKNAAGESAFLRFDIEQKKSRPLAASVKDIYERDGRIFLVTGVDGGGAAVKELLGTAEKLVAEVGSGSYRFLPAPEPYLTLIDDKSSALKVIEADASTAAPVRLTVRAQGGLWHSANELRLAWYDDVGLWTWSPADDVVKLIARFNQGVEKLVWLPQGTALLAQFKNKIIAFEIDDRDNRNAVTILEAKKINDIGLDDKAKNIILWGELYPETLGLNAAEAANGGTRGLFELPIQ